ncbi:MULTISPECIES: lysis protein [Pantoea]|uniref:lysis protein n=1 Tax=Pantoea TaxID=53335 RepID=UPI0028ACD748|nr:MULTISPECIES: lysis protein [Pantoea]MDU4129515.1 lysis protein [Pantoea sp.]
MIDYQNLFITAMAAAMVVDRCALARKKVSLLGCGVATVRGNALAFPVRLNIACVGKLAGAKIEYWLRDSNDPTVVISGKQRTLDLSPKGVSEEFLLIDTRYLEPGEWSLTVRVTHGNSRLNPLYRIFPLQDTVTRTYQLSQSEQGEYRVES